jgi:hypothetical protein
LFANVVGPRLEPTFLVFLKLKVIEKIADPPGIQNWNKFREI